MSIIEVMEFIGLVVLLFLSILGIGAIELIHQLNKGNGVWNAGRYTWTRFRNNKEVYKE